MKLYGIFLLSYLYGKGYLTNKICPREREFAVEYVSKKFYMEMSTENLLIIKSVWF